MEQLLKIRRSSAPRPIGCEAHREGGIYILSDAIDLNQVHKDWIIKGREILMSGIYEGNLENFNSATCYISERLFHVV